MVGGAPGSFPKNFGKKGSGPVFVPGRTTRCQHTWRETVCWVPQTTCRQGDPLTGEDRTGVCEVGELSPPQLLGEQGGRRGANQTSPDLGLLVNGGRGLVLVENKFTEHSFYECSAWRHKGNSRRQGNPDPDRCLKPSQVAENPLSQCHRSAWGRRYWEHLADVVDRDALTAHCHCPAARHGYQLFRQQALAEGIARSGRYELVVSAVAVDKRNKTLTRRLKRSGFSSLEQWGRLFKGEAIFTHFTHQQWVGWVREHETSGSWSDWLKYVCLRYSLPT